MPLRSPVFNISLLGISIIALVNLILYGVFFQNEIFAVVLFIESILFFLILVKNSLAIKVLFLILLSSLVIISLNNGFDNSLLKLSSLEADTLVTRHEHFANELGKLYKNRIGINYANKFRPSLIKFNRNMFSHLDLNLFFNVKNIFSLIFIPFFFLGIYNLTSKINKLLIFYLIIVFIIGGFLVPAGEYGYLLYLPFFNLIIYLGLLQLLSFRRYVQS